MGSGGSVGEEGASLCQGKGAENGEETVQQRFTHELEVSRTRAPTGRAQNLEGLPRPPVTTLWWHKVTAHDSPSSKQKTVCIFCSLLQWRKEKKTKGGKTGITNGGKIESVCERESRGRCSVMQLKRVCPGERYCRKNSAVEGTTVCLLKAVA